MFGWLKPYMPRSLYGRAALILVLPVLTVQLAVSVAFIQRHYDQITQQMTAAVSTELDFVYRQIEQAEDIAAAQGVIETVAVPLGLTIALQDTPENRGDARAWWDFAGSIVFDALRQRDENISSIDLTDLNQVDLWTSSKFGPMQVRFNRDRVSASNPHQLLVIMMVLGVFMTLISFLFLRNQLRPIKRMSYAAAAFGKGRTVPFKPSGAVEVRAAGSAFLDMRNRIERHMEQRTRMLSGVSHDLRTPLTRLKLGLSMIDPEDAAPLQRDVKDMEQLLDGFLNYAKGGVDDEVQPCDPIELVEQIVADAHRAGHVVSMGPVRAGRTVKLRAKAVQRAVENLLSNAMRYASQARVTVDMMDTSIVIRVEDDGPGIPEALYDEALKPFTRLEPARNQDKGSGVGLGLSIVMDIARSHGGTLRLGESADLGGLQADLVLAI